LGGQRTIAVECDKTFKTFDMYRLNMTPFKGRIQMYLNTKRLLPGGSQIDARGKMYVHYKDKSIDSVCFGDLPRIDLNGRFY